MLFRFILALALGALGFCGFKLGLYSERLSAPYDDVIWFLGGLFTIFGTFGALAVAYSIVVDAGRHQP